MIESYTLVLRTYRLSVLPIVCGGLGKTIKLDYVYGVLQRAGKASKPMAELIASTLLIARIFKRAAGNVGYEWANTYEIQLSAPALTSALADMLTAIMEAEAAFHTDAVQYTRGTLSTWVPDSTPYDPLSFMTVDAPLGLEGALGLEDGDFLPRNIVLSVRRSVDTGRSGRLFYRGVLGENDIKNDDSLLPALSAAAITPLTTRMDTFYSAFQSAVVDAGGAFSSMVMVPSTPLFDPDHVRKVTGLVPRGVTIVSPDHKYFDRS